MFEKNALDLWTEEQQIGHIITMCKSLDIALGNGIPLGIITEFCGGPGSGRTQFCHQLCVNAQLPKILGGLDGTAVYIDTKYSFSHDRLMSIGLASENRLKIIYENHPKSFPRTILNFTANKVLENTIVTQTRDFVELNASIFALKHILEKDSNIRLIVIDSFAFPFKFMDSSFDRIRHIYELLTILDHLAVKFTCAVVVTNELTTQLFGQQAKFVPSLGASYSHKIGQQIILDSDINRSEYYIATIRKSLTGSSKKIPFTITNSGIRDINV